jgi:hypothetical protein
LQVDGNNIAAPGAIRAEIGGQPVIIRFAADDAAPAGKDGQDDGDIVRRLRERRAKELGEAPKLPPVADKVRALPKRSTEAADEAAKEAAASDIARRLQLRRAADAEKGQPDSIRHIEAAAGPENPAPDQLRGLVVELAKRAGRLMAPGKKEKMTFLGVGAGPAPPVLTHQLHLPADFGLVVEEVVPEGPADKAGLKQYDLLQKLDDQLLVDDGQLTALIHSHKPGDTVALTVIREGKPLTLKAKLGEHEEIAEGEHNFMLQFGLPPGGETTRPEAIKALFRLAPGLLGPDGLNVPPAAPKTDRPHAPPQATVVAPAEPHGESSDEARRLEQELRSLRETADQLRAQLEARKKQEAEEQKANPPADKDQKDGEKP